MTLEGKGFYIWKIRNCEGGDAGAIATLARNADLSHVLIKVADGSNTYNYDWSRKVDLVPPVVQALHNQGIQVWGWQYVYGDDPMGEARKAIQRVRELDLDGFVVNAEVQYKQPGKDISARRYMGELRSALPDTPLALSSYRYPSYHPQFPWRDFLEKCDYNMPQVYWMQAHNPRTQLIRSVREFQAMSPFRPIIPTGAAFAERGWQASAGEITEFLRAAQELNLSAANFWSWDSARSGSLPGLWEAVRDYPWPSAALPKDIVEQYFTALNTKDPNRVAELYAPHGVHINATRTVKGTDAIQAWYHSLFTQILPNARFELTGYSGSGNSRHLTWTATSSMGSVQNGNDTLGLINGKIAYHYTFFTVTPARG